MRLLLVSPATPDTFWGFRHALPFVGKRAAFPPLGLLTVAAMLPTEWELRLVDLEVEPLTDDHLRWADQVWISAMIVHRDSVLRILDRCRDLDRPVVAGGPLFTTAPEEFPQIDTLLLGEAEGVLDELVADLQAGTPRRMYRAEGFPGLDRTPIPRWDLLRMSGYATMSVQFSRGCPHDCEFCDIVVLNGRKPRTKAPPRLVAELEALRVAGWKGPVFLVDDNFIGHPRLAKELLAAVVAWRRATSPRMEFLTEATVNLARDPGLLDLMVEAGFKKVFLGLESPDPESLRECHKLQNLRGDLMEAVQRIQRAGIEVMGGFIVGFDNDTADVFQRQFRFIQESGVVTAMVGLLTALPRTRLYRRLREEGRLLERSTGNNTDAICNFVPRLDREVLVQGYRQLMRRLYEPDAFYARARAFLAQYRPGGPRGRLTWRDGRALGRAIWTLGIQRRGRRAFWRFLGHTALVRPRSFALAVSLAIYGHHFRRVAADL